MVKSSLKKHGFCDGRLSVMAYGDRKHWACSADVESLHPNIPLFRLRGTYARHTNILLDMLARARMDVLPPMPKLNFMLIIKDMPEEDETEAASIVQFLKTRHYNVLVVVGDEDDKCAYPSDVPLWRWKSLLEGGGPVSSVTRSEEEDDGSDTSDDGKGTSPRKRYRILDYLSRNYGGGEVVGHEPIGSD